LSQPIAPPPQPSGSQLARRLLEAFEREFWAGHHDRSRLLGAPLRVLQQALDPAVDAGALLASLLQALEAQPPAE
jgi:hypothetical protein